MTDDLSDLLQDLRAQRVILEDLYAGFRNARTVGAGSPRPPFGQKNVLALLTGTLDRIRLSRNAWSRLDPALRRDRPEIADLLIESQNLILKILVLDRETETGPAPCPPPSPQPAQTGDSAARAPEPSPLLARVYGRNLPS